MSKILQLFTMLIKRENNLFAKLKCYITSEASILFINHILTTSGTALVLAYVKNVTCV